MREESAILPYPIDAVITWVDGNDPVHARKLGSYLQDTSSGDFRAAAATRFRESGELRYCVRSLLRFAPWIRQIFIITDQQTPGFLEDLTDPAIRSRIKIVDHQDIFSGYEDVLPTFSSLSIEAVMWRIPGLSERFLYMNDDFMLIKPVTPGMFFGEDNVVLRGRWRSLHGSRAKYRLRALYGKVSNGGGAKARVSHHAIQAASAIAAGARHRYLEVPHNPHPLRRSTLQNYFARHPEALKQTLSHRLRHPDQLWAVGLANATELMHGTASVARTPKALTCKPADQSLNKVRRTLASAATDSDMAFVCVQSLDNAPTGIQEYLQRWLGETLEPAEELRNA